MLISQELVRQSEGRSAAVPRSDSVGAPSPTPDQLRTRIANLSFGGTEPTHTEFERTIGKNDCVDEFYLERALRAARPVCRIVVRSPALREVGYATGFLVAPRLLLTNWHVFRTADEAENGVAEFEYKLDILGRPVPSHRFALRPGLAFLSRQELDYALVAVDEIEMEGDTPLSRFGHHHLVPQVGKINEGEWITIVQHPGGQRRQFALRENKLISKQPLHLWYASDTAPGSSGSPAFNDSFQIVALHHSGKARKDENGNYVLRNGARVASLQGVDDSLVDWVANEGVRVSVICEDLKPRLRPDRPLEAEFLRLMERDPGTSDNVVTSPNGAVQPGGPRSHETGTPSTAGSVASVVVEGGSLTAPFRVTLALGGRGNASAVETPPRRLDPAASGGLDFEKAVIPWADEDYDNRQGYDADFLGTTVPMPTVKNLNLVARLQDGTHVIPYEHFSIVMHKRRRLALITAANIDWSPGSKRPEAGKDYSRRGLAGLGPNDSEKWRDEPRLGAAQQLPDLFYTRDSGAFDRGHIVRRDDVCWGRTYDEVRRANGDTYHVTNCSPQIALFNQSSQGIDNWGDLENFVAQQSETEVLNLFAGPVLGASDQWFRGRDAAGPISVRIPASFWKVVIARSAGALQSFAFVLEQDLSDLPEPEFAVPDKWRVFMLSITDLEKRARHVKFPQVVVDSDQFDTGDGERLSVSAGLEMAAVNGRRGRTRTRTRRSV